MHTEMKTVSELKIDPVRNATERLVTLLMLALIFLMAARSPLDGDLFWHLKAGEQTVVMGSPLVIDPFSHTRLGEAWINHSWLAQVFLYFLWQAGSWLAIGFWVAGTVSLIFWVLFKRLNGPFGLRIGVVLLAAVTSAPLWTPRPQLFSLFFLAILVGFLNDFKQDQRRMWILPGIFCLWSNLHGGYVLGLIYLGTFIIGNLIEVVFSPGEFRKQKLLDFAQSLLVWFVSFAVTAINPNGIKMWLVPFQTVEVQLLQQLINEWASPDFHDPSQMVMLFFSAMVILSLCFTRKEKRAVDVVIFLTFALMAFIARRNIGPYALVAAPILCYYADGIPMWESIKNQFDWSKIKLSGNHSASPKRVNRGINLVLFGLICFFSAIKLYAVTYPGWMDAQIEKQYPVQAVQYLSATDPMDGNLFNEYNDGGYLIFLLPSQPVFVDGRTDLFGDEILSDWLSVINTQGNWEDKLNHYEISRVLVNRSRPLAYALQLRQWEKLYEDQGWVIYER